MLSRAKWISALLIGDYYSSSKSKEKARNTAEKDTCDYLTHEYQLNTSA